MTPSDDVIDLVGDIDQHLSVAYADLTVARHGFARCPSARRRGSARWPRRRSTSCWTFDWPSPGAADPVLDRPGPPTRPAYGRGVREAEPGGPRGCCRRRVLP